MVIEPGRVTHRSFGGGRGWDECPLKVRHRMPITPRTDTRGGRALTRGARTLPAKDLGVGMRWNPAKSRVMMSAAAAALCVVGSTAMAQAGDAAQTKVKAGAHTEAPGAKAEANAKAGARAKAKTRAKAGVRTFAPKAKRAVLRGDRVWTAKVRRPGMIRRVEFRINGKLRWATKKAPFRYRGKRGVLDTTRLKNGKHKLKVTAVQKNGRRGSSTRIVRVHNAAPSLAPAAVPAAAPVASTEAPLPPATRFVAPGGNDAGDCALGRPCGSVARAYQAATLGEVIEVAGGNYGGQSVGSHSAKPVGSTPVVVRAAAGQAVTFGGLDVDAADVEFRGVTTRGWMIREGAHNVTMRNVVSTGGTWITSADNVKILGGEIRNADSVDGLQVKASSADAREPHGLLIDGLYIHDITRTGKPTAHVECVQFTAGRDVIIRNSRFNNCGTQGVFFKEGLGGQIDNVLVENSWFGKLEGYYTLIFDDGVSRMVARYNSFAQAPRFGSSSGTSGIEAYGNAGVLSSCGTGVAYRNNVWTGAVCGPGDVAADPQFVNAGGFDLRPSPGSPVVGRGDPAAHPPTDIFGVARGHRGAPTAGAVEAG